MRFISTNRISSPVGLDEAISRYIADDDGLFMPETLPAIPRAFFNNISEMNLREIAYVVATTLLGNDIPAAALKAIVDESFSFDAPLRHIGDNTYILELFHGPTLTFKDYGARFIARTIQYLDSGKAHYKRNVLVATTGNSGAAAANGMFCLDNVNVIVLYPKGLLSRTQTAQFAVLGENIYPIEVLGSIEDCKRLVRQAISNTSMAQLNLTGSNSINIARLIPQIAFAMHGYAQLLNIGVKDADKAVYAMPCGNLSNLVATVISRHLGLPTGKLIAATNINNQLEPLINGNTDKSVAHPPEHTSTPSLDVTYPAGWQRLNYLYNGNLEAMCRDIVPVVIDDKTIADTINGLRSTYGYTIDTHGAAAYAAADKHTAPNIPKVVFATGHPAKLLNIMTQITASAIELPVQLTRFMSEKRRSTILPPSLPALRKFLINLQ